MKKLYVIICNLW